MIDKATPAFPVPNLEHDEFFNGMTLRDYFAAKAMAAELTIRIRSIHENSFTAKDIATWAYQTADAMMKQREL